MGGERVFSESFTVFLRGCILIRVDGFFTERFINLCLKKGIVLRDIKKAGETRMYAKISISDFRRISDAARKTRSRISIVKKSGLPFLMHRYRKRKIAAAGVLLLFVMFFFFNSRIMGIDIKGNERIETEAVENLLESFGVYRGAKIRGIDKVKIQNEMMTALDNIAWIGVNIHGSRVYIEIKERLDTEESGENNAPCDIVAARDGIIEELNIREGQSMVKKNEFVEKGDLLVSGAMDSQVSGIRYVHSYGEVFALTECEKACDYSLNISEKQPTGKKTKKHSIYFGDKALKLFLKAEPKYKNYEMVSKLKKLKFFNIALQTDLFYEYEFKNITLTEKEAFEAGKKQLSEEMKKEISDTSKGFEIKNISAKYYKKNAETIEVTVKFEMRENIAEQRNIDKTENLNYDIVGTYNN